MAKASHLRMPSIAYLVARSYPDHFIGRDNQLPWHLRTDLRNFRRLSWDHAIIMGRKTFDSIGRPLPGRLNIVISRQEMRESENLVWAHDPESALFYADMYSVYAKKKQVFIIGGEKIFSAYEKVLNKVWLTEVFTGPINGDAKFEMNFEISEWRYLWEQDYPASDFDDFPFRISVLMKRRAQHRTRLRDDFLKHDAGISQWLEAYDAAWTQPEVEEIPKGSQLELDLAFEQGSAHEPAEVSRQPLPRSDGDTAPAVNAIYHRRS
jgi:dihydrofolate reductase